MPAGPAKKRKRGELESGRSYRRCRARPPDGLRPPTADHRTAPTPAHRPTNPPPNQLPRSSPGRRGAAGARGGPRSRPVWRRGLRAAAGRRRDGARLLGVLRGRPSLELDGAGGRALDEHGASDYGAGLGPAGDGRGGEESQGAGELASASHVASSSRVASRRRAVAFLCSQATTSKTNKTFTKTSHVQLTKLIKYLPKTHLYTYLVTPQPTRRALAPRSTPHTQFDKTKGKDTMTTEEIDAAEREEVIANLSKPIGDASTQSQLKRTSYWCPTFAPNHGERHTPSRN